MLSGSISTVYATGTVIVVDSNGTPIGTVGNPLFTSGGGGGGGTGVSAVDLAPWVVGVSSFNPMGGVFNDAIAAMTSGQQGEQRLTPNRAAHVNLRTQAGVEIGLVGSPLFNQLSDGATGYTAAKTGQFPAALVGGRLDVNIGQVPGTVSTVNSTSTPLGANAVFTGTSEDISGFAAVNVAVFSDQASAAGGLSIQASTDGTNWDFVSPQTVAASVPGVFTFHTRAKFFRIVYTNGATLQTAFRLQTIFHQVATLYGSGSNSASVQGAMANATSVVGTNPLILGVTDNSNLNRFVISASGQTDAEAGINAFSTGNLGLNASATYDRIRTAAGAQGTTGTGLAGTGPLLIAVAHGTNPSVVGAGQFAYPPANRAGIPFVIGGHPNVITFCQNYTTAQTDTAIVTVSAGTKIVVTAFMITVANSTTADVSCRLGFGTANTPAYGSNGLLGTHPGIAAGSGIAKGNGSGIIGIGADDEDVRFTDSVPTGGSVDVEIEFYTVPS